MFDIVKLLWAGTLGMVMALAVVGCGSSQHVAFTRWSSVGGLNVPTPARFHEIRWAKGVVTSDLSQQELRVPKLESGDFGDLPTYRNGVFLRVSEGAFNRLSMETTPRLPLRLPLNLDKLGGSGAGGQWWSGAFASRACARGCGVTVWIGQKAPAADRAAVLQALAAIKA